MTDCTTYRLEGLEPDNLLAFMALLGLLRVLERAQPEWHPRASWMIDQLPLRPALRISTTLNSTDVVEAAAKGLNDLALQHDFNDLLDLKISPEDARNLKIPPKVASKKLQQTASRKNGGQYTADLWSALVSDAAVSKDSKIVERTPLCLMFGQGYQYFMSRLVSVPQQKEPPNRGTGRSKHKISEVECLFESLFMPWLRPDKTDSFRWDPKEDVRYALRARDPTNRKTKETTQHGANRLAAIGFSQFTVTPVWRSGAVRLALVGGSRLPNGDTALTWPIWRDPISLTSIRALLSHPRLDDPETRRALGIVELRRARRISVGKYFNFTKAQPDTDS